MARTFKALCKRCKKNYTLVTWRDKFPVCYNCQKSALSRGIKDPEMKKMFDIPEELYEKSSFLRDIKLKYLEYGELSEKQIEAFKKVVDKLKEERGKGPEPIPPPDS
ncbi:hypothetical protein D6825_01670 [Candidatus Woesearchaeota archaeon]|nr:MAG: hypothetical protein D6825_01670 [Candidatus Woesearchaeota archaeon]